jgi:hypothetical protein
METTIQLTPPRANGAMASVADTAEPLTEGVIITPENEGNNVRATWQFSLNNIYQGIAHYTPEFHGAQGDDVADQAGVFFEFFFVFHIVRPRWAIILVGCLNKAVGG